MGDSTLPLSRAVAIPNGVVSLLRRVELTLGRNHQAMQFGIQGPDIAVNLYSDTIDVRCRNPASISLEIGIPLRPVPVGSTMDLNIDDSVYGVNAIV